MTRSTWRLPPRVTELGEAWSETVGEAGGVAAAGRTVGALATCLWQLETSSTATDRIKSELRLAGTSSIESSFTGRVSTSRVI